MAVLGPRTPAEKHNGSKRGTSLGKVIHAYLLNLHAD